MTVNCGTFGVQHKPNERVVLIELNLEELLDFMETFAPFDLYRDELREAVEALEASW